jgi:hypothetical protein
MELKEGKWYQCKNGTIIRVFPNNHGGTYCYECNGVNGHDWSVDDRWTIHGRALVDDGYDIVREIDPNYNFPT